MEKRWGSIQLHPMITEKVLLIGVRLPPMMLGFFLCAAGIVAQLYSGLGMPAWGVFHVGISLHFPLTIGQATQIVGVFLLVLSFFLKEKVGLATFLNIFFIGFFIDLIEKLNVIPLPVTWYMQYIWLLSGIYIFGWGVFFYLRACMGAGPRDALMVGLVKKTGMPVWVIRVGIDITVLSLGFMMGGPVGIGTLVAAVGMGISIQSAFRIGGYKPKEVKHLTLVDLFK